MFTYREAQFHAMGDATRQAILERLDGPLPVGKLAANVPVSRPAISQHLRVLEQAKFVTHQSAGTRRSYQLNPAGFDELREYLDRFWTQALTGFKEKVEET